MAYHIAPDKKKHFYVGIPLGFILYWMAALYFVSESYTAAIACFIALVVICYGFEIFSWVTGKGHGDHIDAVAGIAGGIIGMALYRGLIWLW